MAELNVRSRRQRLSIYAAWFNVLIGCCLSALLIANGHAASNTLAPEFEADRLVMAAEHALAQDQLTDASRYLAQVSQLDITPPPEYHYFQALLLERKSHYGKALIHYRTYVNQGGKSGRFYRQSLGQITELERLVQGDTSNSQPEIQWGGFTADQSDAAYQQRLLALYKTPSPEAALTHHINSLLRFYALPQAQGEYFEIVTRKHRIQTLRRSDPEDGRAVAIKENQLDFSVYGLNPYLKSSCGKNLTFGQACWFYAPQSAQEWLAVQNNPVAAAELEKALAALIKTLQKNK